MNGDNEQEADFIDRVKEAAKPIINHFSALALSSTSKGEALRFLMQMRVALGKHFLDNGLDPIFHVNIDEV